MKGITTLLLALAFCIPAFAQTSNPTTANETATSSKPEEQCACLAPKTPRERSPLGDNPYWVFIGFLYACVAADIAARFAKISYKRARYEQSRPKYWPVPIYSHLVLASVIVGTSWMAWSQAFAIRHVTAPKEVISAQALLVIVDFMILVMYFSLVLVVGNERESGRATDLSSPARKHASYWIASILSTYVLWDILTYFLVPRLSVCPSCFWTRSWMSLFCAGLAWLAFAGLKRIRSDRPFWMLAGDISLIALILFYRALKEPTHADSVPSVCGQLNQLLGHLSGAWVAHMTFAVFGVLAILAARYGQRLPSKS